MFHINVAPFKRELNKRSNGIRFTAREHCYNKVIAHISLPFVLKNAFIQQCSSLFGMLMFVTSELTTCACAHSSREFLGQGWMKVDKMERTPYIMKTSQHFNDVSFRQTSSRFIQSCTSSHIFAPISFAKMSNLVASQIMTHTDVGSRASSIEKWVAVADICRCLNNYNGVLEITSALNRSAIYRLKKTWAKVSKQVERKTM